MKVGFIINPIAGMGGRVGLKGTDGVVDEAIKRGAKPVAEKRAIEFLKALNRKVKFYTCSSKMGENSFKKVGIEAEIIYKAKEKTTAEDTKKAVKKMKDIVDLLIFVGGDGTACDVYEALKTDKPMLGVPAGVKMYSAVFALTPRDAAEVVNSFDGKVEEREVMDIDEEAFRKGEFKIKLRGYALVPIHEKIQAGKEIYGEDGKEEIAEYIVEMMDNDTLYIIGGGSTTWEIKKKLGINGSFLGIDLVKNGKLLCKDVGENEIKKFLEGKAKIIVSPLGRQGFIFGRGNQPISPEIIEKVGKENIIVVATKEKLKKLDSLKVDTGKKEIDEMLKGHIKVITGYKEMKLMRIS